MFHFFRLIKTSTQKIYIFSADGNCMEIRGKHFMLSPIRLPPPHCFETIWTHKFSEVIYNFED